MCNLVYTNEKRGVIYEIKFRKDYDSSDYYGSDGKCNGAFVYIS